MLQERQRASRRRGSLLLLLMLLLCHIQDSQSSEDDKKKFGDRCGSTSECGFEGAVCDEMTNKCYCRPELPVTNHLDKCGIAAKVNETCFFNEQCEKEYYMTECKDGVCVCRFQRLAILKEDGSIDCIPVANTVISQRYIDPAMIGILVAMFLMFITICIVLRLFSKARWRETRTIFNTPNPRLMNASLLRETKIPHHDRRGSKTSHAPSRPESVTSLQPNSPISDSRRGSKDSNISTASGKISKSPSKGAATPMLESVAVDIQGTKQ
ncbi:unnamed protein product [Ceutorhynchus assimilis]|uniref:EB domain-containing protein n=1 Tax=Ceutorhynchus assimilis TaxID=467358 RepID=A0A9P0GPD1_9CUCU|nr:unnamed protein product [Ceutorhynchus assimilis]